MKHSAHRLANNCEDFEGKCSLGGKPLSQSRQKAVFFVLKVAALVDFAIRHE
jgi:hypothetical protein